MTTLRCPVCERAFALDSSPAPPFCSRRCQQIDLGRWLGERYALPIYRQPDDDEPERDEAY